MVRMTSMRLHDVHVSSRYNYSDHGRLLRPPFHLSDRPGTLPSTGNLLFTHRGDSCTAALRRSPQFRIVSRTSAKLYVRPANYRDCLIKYTPSVSSTDLCWANISILLICLPIPYSSIARTVLTDNCYCLRRKSQ